MNNLYVMAEKLANAAQYLVFTHAPDVIDDDITPGMMNDISTACASWTDAADAWRDRQIASRFGTG